MKRREFLGLIGGAAALWPLTGRAQQPAAGKWRIALMMQDRAQGMVRQGLIELGYIEGQNLVIEARSNDQSDLIPRFAAELVGTKPDCIVATGTQAVRALQQATKNVPIVMTGSSDPVGSGLIASLARPGGNITGFSLLAPELSGKRLELLREITGGISSVAILWTSNDPPAAASLKETRDAALALSVEATAVAVQSVDELAPAFQSIAKLKPSALVILPSPLMSINGNRIAGLALNMRLPSIYPDKSFPRNGGLMSYGPDFLGLVQRSAMYVDRILKGAKPADLPVEQPTKFELVINLKTTKALGLNVLPTLLARADEVID